MGFYRITPNEQGFKWLRVILNECYGLAYDAVLFGWSLPLDLLRNLGVSIA